MEKIFSFQIDSYLENHIINPILIFCEIFMFNNAEEFKKRREQIVFQLNSLLKDLEEVIYAEGQYHADWYWNFIKSMREETKEFNRFGTRVRKQTTSFSAEWYKNTVYKNQATNRKKVFSTHLPKGTGFRYPVKVFKDASPDELEMINQVENVYEELRMYAKGSTTIRKALIALEKNLLNRNK